MRFRVPLITLAAVSKGRWGHPTPRQGALPPAPPPGECRNHPAKHSRLAAGLLAAATAILLLGSALAAGPDLDSRARDIAKELQCPVCQGSAVADSPSPLAEQMRGVIRQKLEQGETRDQIIAFFVERYGQKVLMDPPTYGFAIAIWSVPILVLGAAAVGVFLAARSWSSRPRQVAARPWPAEANDPADDAYRERLRRALESEGEPAPR